MNLAYEPSPRHAPKTKRYKHDIQPGRKVRIDVFCRCGGTVLPFSTDLVKCTRCPREYLIIRRGRKAQLFPVKPEESREDPWIASVERLLVEK